MAYLKLVNNPEWGFIDPVKLTDDTSTKYRYLKLTMPQRKSGFNARNYYLHPYLSNVPKSFLQNNRRI